MCTGCTQGAHPYPRSNILPKRYELAFDSRVQQGTLPLVCSTAQRTACSILPAYQGYREYCIQGKVMYAPDPPERTGISAHWPVPSEDLEEFPPDGYLPAPPGLEKLCQKNVVPMSRIFHAPSGWSRPAEGGEGTGTST